MSRTKIIATLLAITVFTGCAAITIDLPSITDTPTNERHAGKVVWHDLLTNTPEESRKFYGELFGWEFEKPGIDIGLGGDAPYMLIRHNGRLIGGMVDTNSLNRKENISQWVTVLSVDDVNAAAGAVVANGGKILREPTELRSRGVLAIIEDPTGALFAMVQTKDGDPADFDAEVNGFLWNELWTGDVSKTADFYTQVIGFEREDREIVESGITYHMLTAEGIPRAGVLKNPYGDVPPVWVNYLRVEDPSAVTARVASLGGQILLDTQPRDIGGEVAFIAGPSGAGIALQTWPLERKD